MNLWQRITARFRERPTRERVYLGQSQAGVLVTEDTALTFLAFWACVRVISQTIAALPWGVYERTAAGRRELLGTVGWLLNNQPNLEMTAFSFREALVAHVLTWGNAYAEIVFDLAGRPSQLWLLSPDRVRPERDESTGELRYRVTNGDGTLTFLEPWQVLHLHGLGFDGIMGYSPVRMAARALGVGIAQEVFAQAFFANGATFGTIVELPVKSLSPEQIADAERRLNERRGPAKAFGTRVVPEGSTPHQLGMPLQDAEFMVARKFSVVEMCRLMGVPPHKVADLERSTNNNIEHQGIEFVTDAIVPWAVRLEQEANVKLIGSRSQGRVYTKLCVSGLMRGDSKARAEYYRILHQMGAITTNEIRALEEMNGIGPAGDAHLVQLNQTTLEWLVEHPDAKAVAAAAGTSPPGGADPPAEDDPPEKKPTNVIRAEALAWYRRQRKQS